MDVVRIASAHHSETIERSAKRQAGRQAKNAAGKRDERM
jgi:hypothetical protein